MSISHLALAAFLLMGLGVVYQDGRYRKISNKWIVAGLLFCAFAYAFLSLNTLLGSRGMAFLGMGVHYLPAYFFKRLLWHLTLSVMAALALWYLRIWPAGDAKLFIVFAGFLPLLDQNLRGFPGYLFLNMLVNIFVAAGAYVFLLLIGDCVAFTLRLAKMNISEEIKAHMSRLRQRLADAWPLRYKYLFLSWNTYVVFLILLMVQGALRLPPSAPMKLAVYFGMLFAWEYVAVIFSRPDVAGWSLFILSAFLLPVGYALHWDMVEQMLGSVQITFGFGVFVGICRAFIMRYLKNTRIVVMSSDTLQPGMILSEETRIGIEQSKLIEPEALPERYSDGMTQDEVDVLKGRLKTSPGTKIAVYSTRPFALWVFLGCLWTLASRRNVVEVLVPYFPHR